jgi:hypothetical protein
VGIVDERGHGGVLRVRREQVERRRTDREAILRGRRPERERALERSALRFGNPLELGERWTQQLQQPRERHTRLRLDPARARSTRIPADRARSAANSSNVVLPIPISPANTRTALRLSRASASAFSSSCRSRSRPSSIGRLYADP